MNLLQQLNALQAEHGWLPDDVLRRFSEDTNTPLYRIQEVASFYPHYRLEPPPRAHVAVCRDAACRIAGAGPYLDAIRSGVAARDDVEVHEVSCLGRCEHAPAACVDDVPLRGYDADGVVRAALGDEALPPDEPTETPRAWPSDPYADRDAHYGVLRALLEDPERAAALPDRVKDAGLRGMGGAGFPRGSRPASCATSRATSST